MLRRSQSEGPKLVAALLIVRLRWSLVTCVGAFVKSADKSAHSKICCLSHLFERYSTQLLTVSRPICPERRTIVCDRQEETPPVRLTTEPAL